MLEWCLLCIVLPFHFQDVNQMIPKMLKLSQKWYWTSRPFINNRLFVWSIHSSLGSQKIVSCFLNNQDQTNMIIIRPTTIQQQLGRSMIWHILKKIRSQVFLIKSWIRFKQRIDLMMSVNEVNESVCVKNWIWGNSYSTLKSHDNSTYISSSSSSASLLSRKFPIMLRLLVIIRLKCIRQASNQFGWKWNC